MRLTHHYITADRRLCFIRTSAPLLSHIPFQPAAMSPSIRSKPKPADLPGEDEPISCPPRFTLAGTAALYSNRNFALGFGNTDRQAAARALLRSQSHLDGTHYQTRTPSGLHPAYIAFNDTLTSTEKRSITHEEFVEAALEDVFDAVRVLD